VVERLPTPEGSWFLPPSVTYPVTLLHIPKKHIPVNHTDISKFANQGILDSIWFKSNVGIYVRGIDNKRDGRGVYAGNDSVLARNGLLFVRNVISAKRNTCHTPLSTVVDIFKNSHPWLNFEPLLLVCLE
jgi:hypothetical protein